jgi:AcrR family transcriptional regulator
MVKNEPSTTKGEQTREAIYQAALDLFRENGFDSATMQQIADRAQVAKSAAYYYFASKEAIIQAYYEAVQSAQDKLCADAFGQSDKLKKRLHTALHSKFDLAQDDRKLLGIIFRYTGEPAHPLSCLGPANREMRRRAMLIFRDALSIEGLPRDLEELLPLALWALQMGLLVLFFYDETPNQQRTRRLADGAIEFTVKMLSLAKLPVLKPVRAKVLDLLREADLIPELG